MRTFTTALILLLISSTTFSQGLTKYYYSLDLGYSISSLEMQPGKYNISFIEQSIRSLAYNFDENIVAKNTTSSVHVGLQFGRSKGLSHTVAFDVPVKKHKVGGFLYSLGYTYPVEVGEQDILFRLSCGIGSGDISYEMGSIEVDTTGIIINDIDYIGTDVAINLNKHRYYIQPEFRINYVINQKFSFFARVGYQNEISNSEEVLKIIPKDGAFDKSELGYKNSLIQFSKDAQPVNSNLFNANKLFYGAGFSFFALKD